MTEAQPYIQVAVSDALARIEAKLDALALQMAQKADAATVHELDTRVRLLEVQSSSAEAVQKALGRARTSIWVAVGSLAAGISAVAYIIATSRGR